MLHGKKLPCTIELHTYLDIFIKSMVGLKMSILQIWVTWASKITLKNLQLCSIKLREATPPVTSHITWSRSIKCFILLSFGCFSFKYKSRKRWTRKLATSVHNQELGHQDFLADCFFPSLKVTHCPLCGLVYVCWCNSLRQINHQ